MVEKWTGKQVKTLYCEVPHCTTYTTVEWSCRTYEQSYMKKVRCMISNAKLDNPFWG